MTRTQSTCKAEPLRCLDCGEVVEVDDRPDSAKRCRGPVWCKTCIEKQRRARVREERIKRRDSLRSQVARVLPLRYRRARLCHLPGKLREKFLNLPADKGLLLWGAPGTGKTYSLAAWIRWVLCTGGPRKRLERAGLVLRRPGAVLAGHEEDFGSYRLSNIERITFADLLLKVRATFGDGNGCEERVLREYRECGLLVLEDLGVGVAIGAAESDFAVRILTGLLDYRLEHCLPTFATSNKSPDELGKSFDERIASRLAMACEFVAIKGRDRRRGQ